MSTTAAGTLKARVDGLDWQGIGGQLDARGFAVTEPLLDAEECAGLADLFDAGQFRSTAAPPPASTGRPP